jgi:hypothetical protein
MSDKKLKRSDVTKEFLKKFNISTGSRVLIYRRSENFISWDKPMDKTIGEIGIVVDLRYDSMIGIKFPNIAKIPTYYFEVESLRSINAIPFTFDDREIFKGKWIVLENTDDSNSPIEHIITGCDKDGIFLGSLKIPYEQAYKKIKFSGGEMFGKKII